MFGACPKALLLDRDGVINIDSPDYILSADQWRPVPGSLEAIARLHQAGIKVAIVSNQSALGRGMMSQEDFQAIHAKMMLAIEQHGGFVSHVAYCPHAPSEGCDCRKPKPGMVLDTLAALGMSEMAAQALFVGDSLRDVEAASAASVPALLVASGYGDSDAALTSARMLQADIQLYDNLAAAVDCILR